MHGEHTFVFESQMGQTKVVFDKQDKNVPVMHNVLNNNNNKNFYSCSYNYYTISNYRKQK
jgi:hypothetical protein